MAAASHLNISSSGRKTSFGTAKPPSAWQPQSLAMHVTRPKSAKGRTRSSMNYSHSVADYSYQVPSALQPLARCEEPLGGRRAASSQQLCQPVQVCPAEIPDLLQQVPVRTSSSLNKYRVLPSIARKGLKENVVDVKSEQGGVSQTLAAPEEKEPGAKDPPWMGKGPVLLTTKHKGGGGEYAQISPPLPEAKPPIPEEGFPALLPVNLEEPREGEARLLLAIRSPSGHRFERHFRPTDSLRVVVAAAEAQAAAAYRRCRIKTAEVPRRTFADLSKTLQECEILHKSVLCILQEEDS